MGGEVTPDPVGAAGGRWHGFRLCPPTPPGARAATPSACPPPPSGHGLQGARRPMAPSVAGGPFPGAEQPTGSPPALTDTGVCCRGEGVHNGTEQRRAVPGGGQGGRNQCVHPPRGTNSKANGPRRGWRGVPGTYFLGHRPPAGVLPPAKGPPTTPGGASGGPTGGRSTWWRPDGGSIDGVAALRGVGSGADHPWGGPTGGESTRRGPDGGSIDLSEALRGVDLAVEGSPRARIRGETPLQGPDPPRSACATPP